MPPSISDEELLKRVETELSRKTENDPMSALRREAKRAVVEDALGVIRSELIASRGLRYERGEQRFGSNEPGALAPVDLVASDGRHVLVGGSIDRIDMSPDHRRALVIDYKTGKAPPIAAIGVTAFQLPLYALAVKRSLGVNEVGVAYMSVRQAGSVDVSPKGELGRVLSDAELDEIAVTAADLVTRVAAGNVSPRPHTPRECQRCSARDVCRRPVVVPPQDRELVSASGGDAGTSDGG